MGSTGKRPVASLWCSSMTVNQCARVCRNATSCAVNPPRTEQKRHFRGSVAFFQTPQKQKLSLQRWHAHVHVCGVHQQTQTCLKDGWRPAVTADWISFLRTPLIPLWIFSYWSSGGWVVKGNRGGGALRLVNSPRPQTGFDSVCVALKVTRKKEGQIKAGGDSWWEAEEGTTGTRERDGPTEGIFQEERKPSKHKKQYLRKKKISALGL